MPKKPVFEITGECRAVIVDEKSTFDYVQDKLSEKKEPDTDPILDRLEAFLLRARVGNSVDLAGEKFSATVKKVQF